MTDLPDLATLGQNELVELIKDTLRQDDLGLPFSFATGADRVISHVRAHHLLDLNFVARLTIALELVFEDLERAVRRKRPDSEQDIIVLSRAAFVTTELKLNVDRDALTHTILTVRSACQERPELHNAFLLIVRALGRLGDARQLILFWSELLQFPHAGVRTVAAQNIAKADVKTVVAHLPVIVAYDVNRGLLAHSILRAAGDADKLKEIIDRLDDRRVRLLMVEMLTETGELQAASVIAVQSSVVKPVYLEKLSLEPGEVSEIENVYVLSPDATRFPKLSEVA